MALTCLYCFHDFEAKELHFRCKSTKCPDKTTPDDIYARYRQIPPSPADHFFRLPSKMFGTAAPRCDRCPTESYYPLCPNCHYELPSDFTQVDQHIIAIIGGRSSSKTTYITALVNALHTDIGANFRVAVQKGQETRNRYEKEMHNVLYVQQRTLRKTDPLQAKVKEPLIFRLTFLGDSGKNKRVINLVCFDTAGEDFVEATRMEQQVLYMTKAEGLIFLLDPLQIQKVYNSNTIAPWILRNDPADSAADPQTIVQELTTLFERMLKLRPGKDKIKAHVALTLSKIDLLDQMLGPDSALLQPGNHFGELNLGDVEAVHNELKLRLTDWIPTGFTNNVEASFASYRYFGISSLGAQPNQDGTLNGLNSLRVGDPFLWILYKLGMIKARKR